MINKLDINIEDKVYTNYEYDGLKMNIFRYYYEEEEEKELKEKMNSKLKEKGISEIEYKKILDAFDEMDEKYIYNK